MSVRWRPTKSARLWGFEVGLSRSRSDGVVTSPSHRRINRGAVSQDDSFFLDEMQPDDLGRTALVEMAEYGVFRHGLQIGPILSLRKNAMVQRLGVIAAFGRLGHFKFASFSVESEGEPPPAVQMTEAGSTACSTRPKVGFRTASKIPCRVQTQSA